MNALPTRFWAKVTESPDDCWLWTGAVNSRGYGQYAVNGVSKSVHRLTYTEFRADIPDGLTIDHLCHDSQVCKLATACPHRRCCNPWHMDAVPGRVNNARKFPAEPERVPFTGGFEDIFEAYFGHLPSAAHLRAAS